MPTQLSGGYTTYTTYTTLHESLRLKPIITSSVTTATSPQSHVTPDVRYAKQMPHTSLHTKTDVQTAQEPPWRVAKHQALTVYALKP